jgi:hypothetical protein
MVLKPYGSRDIVPAMAWLVYLHDEFELKEFPEEIQDELLARLKVLSVPSLGGQMSIRLAAHRSRI